MSHQLTLTTDMGTTDPYIPALKGWLWNKVPHAKIVDITHHIRRNDIREAVYVIRHCAGFYPPATVHLIGIEGESDHDRPLPPFIVVEAMDQYFIARDHGLLSLCLDALPDEVHALQEQPGQFPLLDTAVPAAVALLQGVPIPHVETHHHKPYRIAAQEPIISSNLIRGTVIYNDHFGNAITNIRREHLNRFSPEIVPLICYWSNEFIRGFSEKYTDVPIGEPLCLINQTGLVEIAINQDSAQALLGLQLNRNIMIQFN